MVDFSEITLSLLLMAAVCLEASTPKRKVFLIKEVKTWTDARQECKERYIDLAPSGFGTNGKLVKLLQESPVKELWIGAYRDPRTPSSWRSLWPHNGISGNDTNWAPRNPEDKDCLLYNSHKRQLKCSACSRKLPFLCFNDNLVLVNETKTWEDAMQHCKDMEAACDNSRGSCWFTYSLMSLRNRDAHNYVIARMNNVLIDEVWMGLRFLGGEWFWLDGHRPHHERMSGCPSKWEHCGILSKTERNWSTRDCSEKRSFICVKSILN